MKLSALLCAFVVALVAFVLTADRASAQAVNYNSSKSNSGNVTAPNSAGQGKHKSKMAVKGSGVPKNTTKVDQPATNSDTTYNPTYK